MHIMFRFTHGDLILLQSSSTDKSTIGTDKSVLYGEVAKIFIGIYFKKIFAFDFVGSASHSGFSPPPPPPTPANDFEGFPSQILSINIFVLS